MQELWYLASLFIFLIGWVIFLDGKQFFRVIGVLLANTVIGVLVLAMLGFPTDQQTLLLYGIIASVLQIGFFLFAARKFFTVEGWRLHGIVVTYAFGALVFNLVAV